MHMDNNYSLKEVLNMINLCKYTEVDGETTSIVIVPKNDNERSISIKTKGSSNNTSFTFSFNDGKSFDENILPIMVKEFLNNDERLSWIKNDGENGNIRELITTVSGNELYIETNDNKIHEYLEHLIEKPNYFDNKFDADDEAVDKILRYLRERIKERSLLDQLPTNLKKEMISVINSAYIKYNGKNISDEELINYISSIKDNMSKEAYGLFVRDYNENSFLIVKDIKDYLKNEHLYDNYLDEEPYIGLKKAGLKLVEDGYFNIANNFPRKITLTDLKDDNLKELISSKYKSRYKFLLNEEQTYERMGELDIVENIKKFSKYLIKATRLRLKKDLINNVSFKETISDFPHNDLDSLVKAINVYKKGKAPEEWLTLSISIEDEYVVKLSLINNDSKDTNIFKYDKNDKFLKEVLPNIINTFLENDIIVNINGDSEISTFITENGNRIIGNSTLLKDLEKDNSNYVEYEKLSREEENNTITPFGIARKKELAEKDEKIGKLDELNQEYKDNNVNEEEYKKQKRNIIADLKKIKFNTKLETTKDNSKLTFDIPERKGFLESNISALSSYFRKERLKEKGILSASGLKEMLNLKYQSKEVYALEIAKEKLVKNEITKEKYDEIHEYYKNLLVSEIKKGTGSRGVIIAPTKPIVINEYVNKENSTFKAMKSLIRKYKVLLSDGALNVYDRLTNTKYDSSKEEKDIIEFSNLWCSLVGIKPSSDDFTLGSTYAYNKDNEKLFNIIEDKVLNHIKTGKSIDIDSIKVECVDNNIPSCDKIIDRLFQSSDHVAYIVEFFKNTKDVDMSKYITKEEPLIGEPLRGKLNNEEEINKMLSIYEEASNSSDDKYSASMKLFVPKDKDASCQVIVTIGKTFNEKVLYSNIFDKDYIIKDNLNNIVDRFIEVNSLTDLRSYEVPNTSKAGIILTGKNNNVIQFTNISLEDVLVITNTVNEKKNALEENKEKVKTMGVGGVNYGKKVA